MRNIFSDHCGLPFVILLIYDGTYRMAKRSNDTKQILNELRF